MANADDLKLLDTGELDLSGCDFIGADLSNRQLAGRNFSNANLSNVKAFSAYFSRCNFSAAILGGLAADGANFSGASLGGIFVMDGSFVNANLQNAVFSSAILQNLNFSGADLSGANFRSSQLVGSTEFAGVKFDDVTSFEGAKGSRVMSRLPVFARYAYEGGTFRAREPSNGRQLRGVAGVGVAGEIQPMATSSASSGAFDPAAFDSRVFDTAPPLDPGAVPQSIEAIQRALVARPLPIRDAARALAGALKAQAVELQHAKPNEPSKLEEYEGLIQFISETSDGLQALADTIDSAIQDTQQDSPEPVLLGKAAEIANQVHARAMEWLLANRATVFEGAFRIGLFGLGMAFVSALGIELSPAVTASIATLAGTVGKGKPPDAK